MAEDASIETESGFWIFGYGSLIWKPPPHFDRRIPGYVTGYVRRFWQASQDHRGTPEAPGRVVTLISHSFYTTLTDPHPSGPLTVWGTAYRIPSAHVAAVRSYLDIREINGYSIHYTDFHPADAGSPVIRSTLVYIGTPENEMFVGPQDPQELAERIWRSRGPSGGNGEYLLCLEEALDGLGEGSGDGHVKDLADRLRAIAAGAKGKAAVGVGVGVGGGELEKVGCSTDGLEETEKKRD